MRKTSGLFENSEGEEERIETEVSGVATSETKNSRPSESSNVSIFKIAFISRENEN
jgi:hypothetical protein